MLGPPGWTGPEGPAVSKISRWPARAMLPRHLQLVLSTLWVRVAHLLSPLHKLGRNPQLKGPSVVPNCHPHPLHLAMRLRLKLALHEVAWG